MKYSYSDTVIILENLIKTFNRTEDEVLQLKLEGMILCFQHHLKSFF